MLRSAFMSSCRALLLEIASLLLVALASASTAGTSDSWLIDRARYHTSVHGQLSCATCHDAVASSTVHPDPRNVDRRPERADPAASCLLCHDGVPAALERGEHGRLKGQEAAQFEDCMSCHDPHTVIKAVDQESERLSETRPPLEQCGVCHEARQALPAPAADDAACWSCHESGDVAPERQAASCLACHGVGQSQAQVATARTVAPVDAAALGGTPHAGTSCSTCHPGAAAYGHARQPQGDCRQCHETHYSEARDPHLGVDCRACHARGGRVVRDTASQRLVRERVPGPDPTANVHDMPRHPSRQDCQRCHHDGNGLGVSAAVLPAKSVICMGCHAATLSVADVVTIPSLLVFLLGVALAVSLWRSGAGGLGAGLGTVFSRRVLTVLRSLLLDTVLQRRLLRRSPARWAIHSLIFLPFVVRFLWGVAAFVVSWTGTRGSGYLALVDKNHPLNACFFDVTGVMIIVGVCAAVARGIATRRQRLPGLPGQDRLALTLVGAVVVVGFLLEGMRIAMTGASGAWAFLGHAISHVFSAGPALSRSYGHVWYLHAALTGLFVAYLPFSRMFHILVAPAVLAGRALRHDGHGVHSAGH